MAHTRCVARWETRPALAGSISASSLWGNVCVCELQSVTITLRHTHTHSLSLSLTLTVVIVNSSHTQTRPEHTPTCVDCGWQLKPSISFLAHLNKLPFFFFYPDLLVRIHRLRFRLHVDHTKTPSRLWTALTVSRGHYPVCKRRGSFVVFCTEEFRWGRISQKGYSTTICESPIP